MSATSKDFDPIRDDYAFFEEHATEADQDVKAYAPLVRNLAGSAPVRMLDYGCGGGRFSARFLDMASIAPDRLHLSLLEPVAAYRKQAAAWLAPRSSTPIVAAESLASLPDGFDLILANHVFYYVKQLDEQVAALAGRLMPGGLFLAAMAGQDNPLIQIWNQAFALLGKPVPFYTAEDLQAALHSQGIPCRKQPVYYRLAFADNAENREHILRFLLGDHFSHMPREPLLAMFDPFAASGTIDIPCIHEQFIVQSRP